MRVQYLRITTLLVVSLGLTHWPASLARGQAIVVQSQPSSATVNLGDSFQVSLIAQIPQNSAIVGWGMDLSYDPSIVSHNPLSQVSIGQLFVPAPPFGGDGDMLAGLVSPPQPPVYGSSVLLATLTFTATALGTTQFVPGYTISDPLEGFVMPGGQFPETSFVSSSVLVVPAPASTMLILVSIGLASARGRRELRNRSLA